MDKELKTKRATKKNTRKEKYKRNGKYNTKSIRIKEVIMNKLKNKQNTPKNDNTD